MTLKQTIYGFDRDYKYVVPVHVCEKFVYIGAMWVSDPSETVVLIYCIFLPVCFAQKIPTYVNLKKTG